MKKYFFVLLLLMSSSLINGFEKVAPSNELIYYYNENRRSFNRYAPYPYEYYYQRRDGNDGCSWRYTNDGFVYSCS